MLSETPIQAGNSYAPAATGSPLQHMALGKVLSCEDRATVFIGAASGVWMAGAMGLLQAVAIKMKRMLKMRGFFMCFLRAGKWHFVNACQGFTVNVLSATDDSANGRTPSLLRICLTLGFGRSSTFSQQ
jgi:hypothetical protein